MLRELRLARVGVIDEASIECVPGFTAVTGETGAGKTMIVTGVDVLLGGRFEASLVRAGAERALVEARLGELTDEVVGLVDEVGGELDGDELIVARAVSRAGRTRATLGGVQTPLARCADVVGSRVTVHGQAEQQRLAAPDRQREVLDRFAGPELAAILEAYRADWAARRTAQAELQRLRSDERERAREIDLLRFGLDEIAAVDPQPGEDAALRAEAQRLQAVDELRLRAGLAATALAGDDTGDTLGAMSMLVQARKAMEQVADTDPSARELTSRLTEASFLVTDLAADVSSYLADLDADPARLEWVTGRLADLAGLTRKYGDDVEAVLAWSAGAAARLDALGGADERIGVLAAEVAALTTSLTDKAGRLRERRRAAGERLSERVHAELSALAMPHARLIAEVSDLDDLGPHGGDAVSLLFSANPGTQPGPLGRVASGGELSRVRLAIEVVLAEHGTDGHTFIFDEVDAGIGGAVATEVGRRLATLARAAQVLVVTHLAQVAAFADAHYVVHKSHDGQVTTSDVRRVEGRERTQELARMMSGMSDADTALAHAAELQAEAERRRLGS